MAFGEIMERAIGPLLLTLAASLFFIIYNAQSDMIRDAQSIYSSDHVYSQHQQQIEEEKTIEKADLLAVIMAGPSVSLRIEEGVNYLMNVEVRRNGTMQVSVLEQPYSDVLARLVFAKELTNYQGFPQEYLLSGSYDISYEYNADGRLCRVVYVSRGGGAL